MHIWLEPGKPERGVGIAIKRIWKAIYEGMKWLASRATTIVALAAIGAAVFAFLSWRTARDAIEQAERAWIAPQGIELAAPLEAGKFDEVLLSYRNPGKQPAINVVSVVKAFPLPRDSIHNASIIQAKVLNEVMDGMDCRSWKPSDQGHVVFPSGEAIERMRVAVPKDVVAQVRAKENYLLVAGCFAYETFDKAHHSAFCRFLDFGVVEPNASSLKWRSSKCFAPDYAD